MKDKETCSYCGEDAVYETETGGIYACESNDCAIQHAFECCYTKLD